MIALPNWLASYISIIILWCIVLIYYLNKAVITQRQPKWVKDLITYNASPETVLLISIIISPLLLPLIITLLIKILLGGKNK